MELTKKKKNHSLLDVNMTKGEGQMKVKNLFKEKNKCANESSESITKRLATQSQYQRQKNANEVAESREMRLFNQHQYETEKYIYESADHIRQERLANQHQYQNATDKNIRKLQAVQNFAC